MKQEEIKRSLDEIQNTLEKMNGQEVDLIFLASVNNRGVFNGSQEGIGALLIWNMAKYPVIRQIVLAAVDYYLQNSHDIDNVVRTDNPEHEIVNLRKQ